MKRKLTFLLTAVLLLTAHLSIRADEVTYVMSSMGWDNAQLVGSGTFDSKFAYNSGTGNDGASEGPKYYTSGNAVRFYAKNGGTGLGNWMQIAPRTSGSYTITGVEITTQSTSYTPIVKCNIDYGIDIEMSLSGTTYSITGISATQSFEFRDAATTNTQLRVTQIKVIYTSGGGQETVATPTFSPAAGTYFDAQNVSISCTTEGATIRYTLDETEPTESSAIYSTPISVNTTTTIKAKAFKSGYTASNVATATYTFPSLITIAEARALANNEYAMVQGIVTFIDGKNVYVQDATAGIDLFLNANASGLNLGDEVKAYGKKTVYNGLVELTGINQSSSAFAVVSTGNTLPLVVKTIAEIIAGGADALQSTRVKIESATIGTINTSGNTPLTQGENSVNIYKVPALTGIAEGDEVDVIGVVGYYNNAQIRVANAADVTLSYIPDPQLAVSTSSLSDFRYIYGSGPSTSKNFTVSGSDLANDVTLTAPTNYELSHSPSNGYFDSETLSPVSGTLDETTIYVRLKAGLEVGDYTGNLTIVCGSLSQSVALSGTVSEQPVAAAPTFSPAAGSFITAQTVSMSCETEGATIYYTTDGTEPTESSYEYSEPITVSTTTTIKAIAVVSGYQNSSVAEATYTINEPIAIATARALENDEYACVEGVVIFIDGRNVHVQDATAGIDLYLTSNAPSSFHIGDMVRAYGKKTVYNHLVELTGINATNADVFVVLSTGNTLPEPAIQTIADINSDFDGGNMMQSTRVKIETAIIGTINTSGNTTITQNGSSLIIYRIPSVPGMIAGDWVTLTGIVSCYNGNLQLRVVSADDVEYTHRPTLTANPTSITGLDYDYEQGGPSEIANFYLTGQYLLDNVRVYPSENFEVSTFAGNSFAPENPAVVFSQGHFNNIKIYVRLKANLDGGTYNEQLCIASQYADTLFINVTGTVTGAPLPPEPPTPPTPGDGNYVRISDLSNLTDGSLVVFAARFDENATNYYAMTNASSGKPEGVPFISATADENEVLPTSIVDEESNYYWTVGVTANGYTFTNAANELIGYSSSTNFATGGDNTEWEITNETSGEGTMVPNYTGFVITNVNNNGRAFALNSSHNFGPYAKSNMTGTQAGNYNFYLDLFVKTEGGTCTVAAPTFDPAGGTYYEAQDVVISCTTSDATIYYSLESENGPWIEYEEAITVDESMTIWAYSAKDGCNNSDTITATYTIQLGFVTIFNQDWEGEMNGWTFVNVEGEMEWTIATYSGNKYAYANGYNHGANEDWCISPVFNLNAYSNPMLSFRTATKYDGNVLQVMFSDNYNGDPTTATWTELTCALSTGNYTWVESGNIDLSEFAGDSCYIGFKYTCEESQAAAWEVDDIMLIGQTSEPVITVSPLTLMGFTYIEGNGPSDEQSFTVSGLNLSNDITITGTTNFEISLTSGDDFDAQDIIPLTPVGGNVEDTIYVRLKAGLTVDGYGDEHIVITCAGLDSIEVTCSGSVTEAPVPGDDYVRISDVSELAAGNRVILASRYNETTDAYLAIGNTLSSNKLPTTAFTSLMNGDDEIIPADILADEDDYYWTVDVTSDGYTFTNANGEVISYGSGTNFNFTGTNTSWTIETGVSDTASMVPEYFGFNIVNFTNNTRAFAVRYYNEDYICGAYSTSNMTNSNAGEYNFFLDIFMQGEGGSCTVAVPTFDPAGGTYYEPIDVTLSCVTADATIYYSLESGIGPWEEYEEAITVDENMTIWAYAAKEGCNDSSVDSAEYIIQDDIVIIFNQDWEDDWNGWTEVCVYGDSLWRIASYQGNHYAYANGYNHPATEDWLISPAFDLDSYSDVVLTFVTAKNYTGDTLKVYFSNDYDEQNPTGATWEELECELSTGGWNWVPSGEISLDQYNGMNCYIGFKYTCNDTVAAGWEVDDIMLVSGTNTNPTITATPNNINGLEYIFGEGPSDSQSYALTAANLNGEGDITVTASEGFEISLDDEEFFDELPIPFADGVITDQPVTVYVRLVEGLDVGTYEGTISHAGGDAYTEVSVAGTVHSENEPSMSVLMPLYIQGNNGSNNNRVPMAAPAYFLNLEPNTTYRYTNQFVVSDDGPETAGAGNVIYANPEGFYRSTSPSLATEGGYGEFTTDEYGRALLVWLMNEPTANARFTPGNHVYLRVRINDGHDGTTVDKVFTSDYFATVLNFGNEYGEYQGTAFYVKSNEAPMSFAMLFGTSNDGRPIYSTSIETIGVDFGGINQYADFYKEEVAGKDGWFGGILPNDNETGINFILTADLYDQNGNQYFTEDGQWYPSANTINPSAGLDEPIFIDLTDDGVEEPIATNVKVWNTGNEFVIENGNACGYTMNIINMMGQTLISEEIAANSTVRISHNLAAGVYVINLQNNQSKVAVKVMVK